MDLIARVTQILAVVLAATVFAVSAANAEEWVASKLRGAVFVYTGTEWQQIYRGHRVDSARAIQTSPRSRVVFTRGRESIDVQGDTRIRIQDRDGQLKTIVEQDFGEITVDVDKRNVKHFAVRAPLLTAVVKGTKFTVRASKSGSAAQVAVARGLVEVSDREREIKVNVSQGQKAARNQAREKCRSCWAWCTGTLPRYRHWPRHCERSGNLKGKNVGSRQDPQSTRRFPCSSERAGECRSDPGSRG